MIPFPFILFFGYSFKQHFSAFCTENNRSSIREENSIQSTKNFLCNRRGHLSGTMIRYHTGEPCLRHWQWSEKTWEDSLKLVMGNTKLPLLLPTYYIFHLIKDC